MLSFCTELDVLCIDGWETSIGIRNERNEADRLNIRERFTTYDDVIKGGRFG